jgi:ornithine cyclodeaminase
VLLISRADVEDLLDVDELVDVVAGAMVDVSRGQASMPPRAAALVAERHAFLASMTAFLPSARALCTKLVSLFPDNRDRPTHQAVIVCFDPSSGTPIALMDGTYITAARTAAGSALATRLLARGDSSIVTVIGTGVQARAHARALSRLAGIEVVQIAGRNRDAVASLVAELVDDGIEAKEADSIEGAVRSADVVCATTHSDTPVVRRAWLAPGAHVNSVGCNAAGIGEVDIDTVRDALVVVETRAEALTESPTCAIELCQAIAAGVIDASSVRELGEIAAGDSDGRSDGGQLTLYKSVGIAAQDAAAAALVLDAATRAGTVTAIDV